MTGPVGAALLVAHILAVVIAYGSLGATGVYARMARSSPDPFASAPLRQYFRPGHNVAGRVLFVVPVLGFGLLLTEPSSEYTRAYPWIGVAIWTISIVVATGTLWPAEQAVQDLIAAGPAAGARAAVRARAREVERASGLLAVLFVVAVVAMIVRV